MWYLLLVASVLCLAHSKMKLCLFASYTYKRKSIRVFRTPILVYLDVRGVEIPLLSTVSISNCRYQEAPGEVVWSDFLAQLPRRSIEILWHLTRPSGLVKCQRISILLLGNCARISQTRVAGLVRLSAVAKMSMKPFVKRVFTIFATNVSFLRVISNFQI